MATALRSSQRSTFSRTWKNAAPNAAQTSRQIFAILIRDGHLMFNQGKAIQKALQTDWGHSLPRALSEIFPIRYSHTDRLCYCLRWHNIWAKSSSARYSHFELVMHQWGFNSLIHPLIDYEVGLANYAQKTNPSESTLFAWALHPAGRRTTEPSVVHVSLGSRAPHRDAFLVTHKAVNQ